MSVIKKETIDVRKVGTALIGGDFTGNARGANALDIQTARSAVTQVASGFNSVAIGYLNTASGYRSNAIGYLNTASGSRSSAIGFNNTASGAYSTASGCNNTASGDYGTAIGRNNTASGYRGTAIGFVSTASGVYSTASGYNSFATALGSTAYGYKAYARIERTTNINGPQIIRKDNGESAGAAFESFCGVEVILMSKEVSMLTVADRTITLPTGCKFWLNEIGVIATSVVGLTTQPTVRFGITGTLAKHRAAALTTLLTATSKRDKFTPLVPEDGETSLTAGVTVVATATTFLGRFYWKGMLVEDE